MRTQAIVKGALMALSIMALPACNGQSPQSRTNPAPADSLVVKADTPKVEVRVNKEYDEHGNLIAYDSTYTSFYSTRIGDAGLMDSLFRSFKPHFDQRYPLLNDPGFNDLFFNDTLLYQDFFHRDFFRKRMELNELYMQRMMDRMDSFKNEYFRDHSRALKKPDDKDP